MKKSMLAATVVATAFAASANAGYWNISGMSASGSTLGSGNLTMFGEADATIASTRLTTGTAAVHDLSSTDAAGILSDLSITLTNDTLTYFSWEDSGSAGLGYFAVAFQAGGSGRNVSFTAGEYAGNGTYGVNVTGGAGSITADVGGNGYSSGVVAIGGNSLFMMVFGGYGTTNPGFNLNGTLGTNTNIQYLSYNGSAYTVAQSGATNGSNGLVSLSIASYVVPVPAPALLAGAGLVGAAALRRRMAKKA